ncbi:MAG TPA: tetratricopeptide repeat protein [Terracidiphilus sp.]|jgi:tetratricopeptide (TPR) repeat protein/DNA-binding winged helix-turn-helix (wHTH) protein
MENLSHLRRIVRFGPFEADLSAETLQRNGIAVRLQDQPLKLLLLLLERPGEIVTREEVRNRLWPDDSYGEFDNGLNVAVRKVRAALGDEVSSPRYVETIPRRGYRFVGEVMPVDPAPLVQTPLSTPVPDEAGGARAQDSGPRSVLGRLLRYKTLWIGLCGALLLLAAIPVLVRRLPSRHVPIVRRADSARRSVAVLGFRNSSGQPEDSWLSTALSEMFSTELAAGDHLRLIPGEDVVHLRQTLPGLDVDSLSSGTAQQLKQALDTDLIVCGSYAAVANAGTRLVRLDVRLQDAASGEILTEVSSSGSEESLFQLVGDAGERLRRELGVSEISADQHNQVLASMPSNRAAGELYTNGLIKLHGYDAIAAKDLLERSIAADPHFPLAHAYLADAWSRLGYDERAAEESKKAIDLSSSLLPTERLQVQARSLAINRNWEPAAKAYRSLYSSFPDDPDYAIQLAECLTRAGAGKDALALLQPLGAANAGGRSEIAKVNLAIADSALALGDSARASQSAESAATVAREQEQLLIAARALRTQGLALEDLKQYDKALTVTEEARKIYAEAGDRFGVASVFEVRGNVFSDRGDLTAALDNYQQELTIVREVGNKRGQASALNNMALVFNQQGDLERSRGMWEQAQTAFSELGDKSNSAVVLVNLGGVFKDEGDLARARSGYERALALSRQMNDADGTALALDALGTVLDAQGDSAGALKLLHQSAESRGASGGNSENLIDTGDVLLRQGDLASAQKMYQNALTASGESGEKSWSAYAHFGLGKVAFVEADFADAQRHWETALELRKDLGEVFTVAETEVAIAELQIAQGHAADAEPALQRAAVLFHKAGKQDDLVTVSVLLSEVALSQGRTPEAVRALDAIPASNGIQQADTRIGALLAKARVMRAQGKVAEARSLNQSALKQATEKGYRGQLLEARLGLLECDANTPKRRKDLSDLSIDARQAGFKRLSQKAADEIQGK